MEENPNLSEYQAKSRNGASPQGEEPSLPKKPVIERSSSHNNFFKYAFSIPGVVNQFLEWILPKEKSEQICIHELVKDEGSFLDENLSGAYADLLFRVPVNVKTEKGESIKVPGYLFILMEHKSYNDINTVVQEVRYIVRIWEREQKNAETKEKRKLPFVLPITFYHGLHPFTGPLNLRDLIEHVPCFEDFLPSWKTLLVDLRSIPYSELPKDWVLNFILSVLKLIFDPNTENQFIKAWFKAAEHINEPGVRDLLAASLYYYYRNKHGEITPEFEEATVKMSTIIDVDTPLSYVQLERLKYGNEMKAEGIAEGRAEGRAEGEKQSLLRFLKSRFGDLPIGTVEKVQALKDSDEINRLMDIVLAPCSLSAFMDELNR